MSESSDTFPGDGPDELELLAGEYVLGVLDADVQRAIRARAAAEPALAQAIAVWERRLAPLASLVESTAPPRALWDRIASATDPLPDPLAEPLTEPAALATSTVASRPAPNAANDDRRGAWNSVGLWRGLTAGALGLAAALALVAFLPRPSTSLNPNTRVAALAAPGATPPAFVAEVRPDGSVVLVSLAPGPVPEGRDLELWMLPAGAKRPVSLGVVQPGGRTLMRGTTEQAAGQLLVSFEPRGGSPSGQPTGQVVYAGALTGS